jgi:hypothetical protein
MIEIGKASENSLTYDEAVLYCFCLGDGWRLPTQAEYYTIAESVGACWYQDDPANNCGRMWPAVPVRVLKSD